MDEDNKTAFVKPLPDNVLENIVIPYEYIADGVIYGVTSIDMDAFFNNLKLKKIIIPESVTGIYSHAFYGCENLESITLPKSVTRISDGVFGGCIKLTDIYYRGSKKQWDSIIMTTEDESELLRISKIHYEWSEEYDNTEVESFIKSLKYYGDANIIPSDSSLFTFTILSEDNRTARVKAAIKNILGDLVIPYECVIDSEIYSVTTIEANGFSSLSGTTSVTIPKSVTSIEDWSFGNCSNMIFKIPNTIKSRLGEEIFPTSVYIDIYYEGSEEQWKGLNGIESQYPYRNIYYEWSNITKDYVDNTVKDYVDEKTENLEKIEDLESSIKLLNHYGDANVTPSDVSLFTFVTNEDQMTVMIQPNSNPYDVTGDIVIPYEYVSEGKTYMVDTVNLWGYSNVNSWRFPNTLKVLGLTECNIRGHIVIPDGVEILGSFGMNPEMTAMTLPKSLTEIIPWLIEGSALDIYYKGSTEDWKSVNNQIGLFDEKATMHYDCNIADTYILDLDGNACFLQSIFAGRNTDDNDDDLILVTKGYLKNYIETKIEERLKALEERLDNI